MTAKVIPFPVTPEPDLCECGILGTVGRCYYCTVPPEWRDTILKPPRKAPFA